MRCTSPERVGFTGETNPSHVRNWRTLADFEKPVAGSNGEPFWSSPVEQLLDSLETSTAGLSSDVAAQRLAASGLNTLERWRRTGDLWLLVRQFTSPIVLMLIAATLISLVLGDFTDGLIILAIVFASGLLSFWQERAASRAMSALLARVAVMVEVRRDGTMQSIPIEQVVSGDVVMLNAGDVIPGDSRVLEAESLLIDEAALTGESFPVEKVSGNLPVATPLGQRTNTIFMGSHVVSGKGIAVVVQTGRSTEFGHIAGELEGRAIPTGFERGVTGYGLLLARTALVLIAVIFVGNLLLARPVVESLLFSLALAVGLTPQLLPAIVSVSLATGARKMAEERVIVKRLDAIEDFGSMTVLCTDKTGTITEGAVTLVSALDVFGNSSDRVWRLAWLNAHYQTGYANPLDEAILRSKSFDGAGTALLGEVPYDFVRKRLSVAVSDGQAPVLITKGALLPVLAACSRAATDSTAVSLAAQRTGIDQRFEKLSAEGFRVLGVATHPLSRPGCTADDEHDMTFAGFLVFSDPPKSRAAAAIADLTNLGIEVCLVTGDNRLAAAHAATAVGLPSGNVLTGEELDCLTDDELARSASVSTIFAEVQPAQKERLVRALQAGGHVIGFLGDGINDAPALNAADVGISVDTAVDVAKQSAAIVLLERELAVVADGVRLGRETFANTLKYINVTTSANFGNVLSMAVAAFFLPFLPLLPRQILLLNFLSDIPALTLAGDRVDEEMIERPRIWDVASIRNFMLTFGSISSIFDIGTFITLRRGFDAGPEVFRSGWFLGSVLTELAVMLVLRTKRPFFRSRPGRALLVSTAIIALITIALPFSPFAASLGLVALPPPVLLAVLAITAAYIAASELAKRLVNAWM